MKKNKDKTQTLRKTKGELKGCTLTMKKNHEEDKTKTLIKPKGQLKEQP